MTYFANCYASDNSIYPKDPVSRAIVDRLLQYDLNILYRSLSEFLIPIKLEGKSMLNLDPVKERKVVEALTYLESILQNSVYTAADHLTLSDFSIYYSLEFADEFKYDFKSFQKCFDWYSKMKETIGSIEKETRNIKFNNMPADTTDQLCI